MKWPRFKKEDNDTRVGKTISVPPVRCMVRCYNCNGDIAYNDDPEYDTKANAHFEEHLFICNKCETKVFGIQPRALQAHNEMECSLVRIEKKIDKLTKEERE